MTFYSRHDPSGQWSRLIDRQRKQQEQQEKLEKEENEQRKKLYRDELQKLIDEQKLSNAQRCKNDQDFNGIQQKYLQSRDQQEYNKIMSLKNKEQENAQYAYELEQQKKELMVSLCYQYKKQKLLDERVRQQEYIIMMNQAEKQEQMNKIQQKEKVKQELSSAYQQQEDEKRLENYIMKQKEQEIQQQYLDRMEQQEMQRQEFLYKIKQGYSQNNQVLQKYNQIYLQKEEQQRDLQKKLIEDAALQKQMMEDQKFYQEQMDKQKKKQQTMDVIKDQIQQKQMNRRVIQDQKAQEQEVLAHIQSAYSQIDREKQARQYDIKHRYRDELKLQIEQDKSRRAQEASMSAVELNMNKSLITENEINFGIGVVPGLSNHVDYERQKQKAYVDMTLNKSVPSSLMHRRQRNSSAYVAANDITNNIFGY